MMKTIKLTNEILEKLEGLEGKDIEGKITNLLRQHIQLQLRDCSERILKYETKYGMEFEQFKSAWKNNQIKKKHSHEVERDFMEWEGYVLERQRWLSTLRELKNGDRA